MGELPTGGGKGAVAAREGEWEGGGRGHAATSRGNRTSRGARRGGGGGEKHHLRTYGGTCGEWFLNLKGSPRGRSPSLRVGGSLAAGESIEEAGGVGHAGGRAKMSATGRWGRVGGKGGTGQLAGNVRRGGLRTRPCTKRASARPTAGSVGAASGPTSTTSTQKILVILTAFVSFLWERGARGAGGKELGMRTAFRVKQSGNQGEPPLVHRAHRTGWTRRVRKMTGGGPPTFFFGGMLANRRFSGDEKTRPGAHECDPRTGLFASDWDAGSSSPPSRIVPCQSGGT